MTIVINDKKQLVITLNARECSRIHLGVINTIAGKEGTDEHDIMNKAIHEHALNNMVSLMELNKTDSRRQGFSTF